MSRINTCSGKILPKVLRRAHQISEPSWPKRGEDIEGTLVQTCKALQEIQRQIHKGEETYFEETTSHANIFKGWDAFLDVRLEAPAAVTQVRRMPADYKWMSSSSVGIPKYKSIPYVSLENAREKKRQNEDQADEKETSKRSSVNRGEGGVDSREDSRESKGVKRKEGAPDELESQNEESTPVPRRTKRSKRNSG
ncbi:hypothetical protein FisN_19Lh169 [Fistulifera solaris]|uniref:Chromatin modification-related protein EAF6 n=1 Tax=Fistulifera solaris TaxID=1519565 RepID=A0A1Z5J6U6_FISSO|nr:hypothetical protein FisN_19Lh169 [Fistulifera solaris]|eukprot:GAX09700.1 hypothetical protein FisN_19Lh169 [Fistulifera solaris]